MQDNDKKILLDGNDISNMSIFSKLGTDKQLYDYTYFESDNDEYIYYINMFYGHDLQLFIDKDKKILFYSRYYHSLPYIYVNIVENILHQITNIDIDNALDIGTNIIACQKWFITYGHFHDESYILADFYEKVKITTGENFTVLNEYHTDNSLITYPFNNNYKILNTALFNHINAYDYKKNILKMKKLHLIKHTILDTTFHSFPINIRNQLLLKNNYNQRGDKNIFITRGKALHLTRNLNNENEIEEFLISKSFHVINPEKLTLFDFINSIRNADNVVITWGGALTNLIYLKENTNVIILKSKSYEHESIELFNKIITTYKLNVNILVHYDNNIDLVELSNILNI